MIHVFLPAYNEEIALERIIQKIDRVLGQIARPYRIVVLDDGSTDQTAKRAQQLASRYPITLLKHPTNQGLGQTMIDGFNYLAKEANPEDLIVTLDCDDTHEPQYLPAAFKKISEGHDLVILSRFQKGSRQLGLTWVQRLLSFGAGAFLKLFFPISGVRDYSCSFRVFRASIIQLALRQFGKQFISLPHLGFVVACEILVKLRMIGCKMAEVPFTLKYDQKPGKSKNNRSKTIAGYFVLVKRYGLKKRILVSSP